MLILLYNGKNYKNDSSEYRITKTTKNNFSTRQIKLYQPDLNRLR